MGKFRYITPDTVTHSCVIDGPGVWIEGTGTYDAGSGELLSLEVSGDGSSVEILPAALAAMFGSTVGRDWMFLDAQSLGDAMARDLIDAEGEWADYQADCRDVM